jgi:predicted secreted protein
MKKWYWIPILLVSAGAFLSAGDAAYFVDLGFSRDGRTYLFGEYGKTDLTFHGYAEIYAVDVARNDYVQGEVFRLPPSSASGSRSSLSVFQELQGRSAATLAKYGSQPVPLSRTLYMKENEAKPPLETLVFEDYERATGSGLEYTVRLIPNVSGSGSGVRSSLDIMVEERDPRGSLRRQYHVGNPQIVRQGVRGYSITRVYTDESGQSLVFVVEKTIQDSTGTSIRYMVETCRR